jgi:uncharacterized membrane protein
MTHDVTSGQRRSPTPDLRVRDGRPPEPPEQRISPLWRGRIGIGSLIAVVGWFLIYELPPYLGLDSKQARIILNKNVPLHYPILIVHIAGGSIAMITMCIQVIPWVRRHHPKVHRVSGRFYIFAGVLPCAVMALFLDRYTSMWEGNLGIVAQALLWLGTTATGYRMARQHRWAQHRRWMVYSFAIVLGNVWGLIAKIVYVHNPVVSPDYLFETARWVGWMANLVIAQWWLERTGWRPSRPTERAGRPARQPVS